MTTTSIHTTTIFYQYPNTFHKPVSPTLLGSTVVTSTQGQTSSYSLPSGASTFDVTVSNVTTTYTSTNTFHGAVSKSWLVTTSYEVRNFVVSACGLLHLVQFFSIAALDGVFFVLREPYPTWHATGLAPSANSLTPHQFANPRTKLTLLFRLPWVSLPPPSLRALLPSSVLVLSVLSLSVPLLSCKKVDAIAYR